MTNTRFPVFSRLVGLAVIGLAVSTSSSASTAQRARTLPHPHAPIPKPARSAPMAADDSLILSAIDVDELTSEDDDATAGDEPLKFPLRQGIDRAPAIITHSAAYGALETVLGTPEDGNSGD